MASKSFHATMSKEELLAGEKRQLNIEQSRKLAMAAGLTKSSKHLRDTWESNPETFITLLKGAVAAYEQNLLIEELLRGAISRLLAVGEADQIEFDLLTKCVEITSSKTDFDSHLKATTK